jgi:hypothetical protein
MEGYLASSAVSTTRQRIFTVHVIQMRCSGNDGWVKPLDTGLHDLSEDRAKNVAENVQEGLSVGFLLGCAGRFSEDPDACLCGARGS